SGRGPTVSSFDPDADENAPRPPAAQKKLWTTGPISPREAQQRAEAGGFRVGQKVKHAVFGTGVVLKVTGEDDNTTVEAAFPNVGVKKLLLAYAKLEKVS